MLCDYITPISFLYIYILLEDGRSGRPYPPLPPPSVPAERESHAYCLKRETPTPELPPGLCCVCVYTHTHTHTHTLLQDSLLWWGGNSGSCNGIDDTNGSMDDLVQQNSVVTGSGPAPSPEVSVPGQVAKSQLIKLSQRYPPLLGPSPRQMSPQMRLPL